MAEREAALADVLPGGGGSAVDEPHAHVEIVVDAPHDEDASGAGQLMAAHEDVGEARTPQRIVRGRYAKFTANMDVVMLEAMRTHNPFTAKHGTRLQMWQLVAETVGEEVLKNPDAYSWHTCRDRVTTLMKLYADGKHDKLFKHGTIEENTRKEAILREFHLLLNRKGSKPGSLVRAPTVLEASVANPLLFQGVSGSGAAGSTFPTGISAAAREGRSSGARNGGQAGQKRRRLDGNSYAVGRTGEGGHLDSDTFRARVLELMETKIQFDMEQRAKENELREQEFELQKRFLEYLQTK